MQTPAEEYGLQEACRILSPLGRTFNLLSWGTVLFQVVQLKDMHLPAFYSHTARWFKGRESIWSKRHYNDLQVWNFRPKMSSPIQRAGRHADVRWLKYPHLLRGRQSVCLVARLCRYTRLKLVYYIVCVITHWEKQCSIPGKKTQSHRHFGIDLNLYR